MEKEHHKLDVAMMKRLYEWGGLMFYTITYFDPVNFNTVEVYSTFSETTAKKLKETWEERKYAVKVESRIVRFNGAFALKD